jgi:hypothetical protein
MGRSSVEATNVLRICAVRAMRSALLACLPLLVGLRRLALLLEKVLVLPVFAFALFDLPVVLLDAFVSAEAGAFFLLDAACFAAGSWAWEDGAAREPATIKQASTAAAERSAGESNNC